MAKLQALGDTMASDGLQQLQVIGGVTGSSEIRVQVILGRDS